MLLLQIKILFFDLWWSWGWGWGWLLWRQGGHEDELKTCCGDRGRDGEESCGDGRDGYKNLSHAALYMGPYYQPATKAKLTFHPSWVGKWVPTSAGKAKAGMVHSVSRWTRGVQVKLWDPLRTRAIPERLRGVFTTRRYTNTRLPLPLPNHRVQSHTN